MSLTVVCLVAFILISESENTSAGVFSFVNKAIGGSEANAASGEIKSRNLQTISLLEAAVNTNPNPTASTGSISIVDDSALETSVGPSGTASEVEAKVGTTDKVSVYVVHDDDTLSSIAKMFNVSVNTIIWANDLKSAKDIHKNQELVILPISGVQYTVKKGDTLKSIATKYRADLGEIADFNGIAETSALAIGDEIIIPDGEATPVSSGSSLKSAPSSLYASAKGYFIKPTVGIKSQGLHGKNRSGVDLAGAYGTSVYAAASGKIIVARTGGYNGGYGNYIVIQHTNGMQSLYAHLSEVDVSSGSFVDQGQFIGRMGSSGRSTGAHLHFEILGASNWNPFN